MTRFSNGFFSGMSVFSPKVNDRINPFVEVPFIDDWTVTFYIESLLVKLTYSPLFCDLSVCLLLLLFERHILDSLSSSSTD